MTDNWAQSLYKLLLDISQNKRKTDRFLSIAAGELNLEGTLREVEALGRVVFLIQKTREGIEGLECSDTEKQSLSKALSPFANLENFAHAHMTLEQAKIHFLKSENILGLSLIDFAFRGAVHKLTLSEEVKSAVDNVDTAIDALRRADLPDDVAVAIFARLTQVKSIVENFDYYSKEELQSELEKLVGALVFASVEEKAATGLIKNAMGAALMVIGALNVVETATAHVAGSLENVRDSIDLVDELANGDESRTDV
jgi:hypothetical protein